MPPLCWIQASRCESNELNETSESTAPKNKNAMNNNWMPFLCRKYRKANPPNKATEPVQLTASATILKQLRKFDARNAPSQKEHPLRRSGGKAGRCDRFALSAAMATPLCCLLLQQTSYRLFQKRSLGLQWTKTNHSVDGKRLSLPQCFPLFRLKCKAVLRLLY